MSKSQSKDVCSKCGGEMEYERPFHDSYHRFDQYRCRSCGMPVHFDRDPLIRDEFPEIEEVTIEVLNREAKAPTRYNKDSHDVLLCCWNSKCKNTGVPIGMKLREMLGNNELHSEYPEFCNGAELTPTGRIRRGCDQSFKITIDIVLKSQS